MQQCRGSAPEPRLTAGTARAVFVLDGLWPMGDATLGREALSATFAAGSRGVRFAHRILTIAKE